MSDIEQEFFNTFGVKKIKYCKNFKYVKSKCYRPSYEIKYCKNFKYVKSKCYRPSSEIKCIDCIGANEEYPKITDRKLLEIICVAYKTQGIELTIDDVKNEVLNNCIKYKDDIKQQIQQLFKEGE